MDSERVVPRAKYVSGGTRPQRVVGPVLVVGDEPRIGEPLHFLRGHPQKVVEDLLAAGSVEPFDEGVRHGLPGWRANNLLYWLCFR